MAEETAVENGRISNFEGLVTLTLDQVRHTDKQKVSETPPPALQLPLAYVTMGMHKRKTTVLRAW